MTYEELIRWWGYWTPEHHLSDYLDTNGGGREGAGERRATCGASSFSLIPSPSTRTPAAQP